MKLIRTYATKKFNLSKRSKKIKYLVIHNTGTNASAKNNCIYFSGGNRKASADFFIGKDGTIYQYNADILNLYSWHCGDGGGKYGIVNSNSISIECVGKSKFTDAQIIALSELITSLKSTYGISASDIVRHYDASRKKCPAYYVSFKNWNALINSLNSKKETPAAKPTAKPKAENKIMPICKEVQKALGVSVDAIFGSKSASSWTSKVGYVSALKNRKSKWAKYVQRALIAKGYSCGSCGADGIFGNDSDAALRKFQKANKLLVDGKAGKETCKKLFN